jgi:hypothetical protein
MSFTWSIVVGVDIGFPSLVLRVTVEEFMHFPEIWRRNARSFAVHQVTNRLDLWCAVFEAEPLEGGILATDEYRF